ncbi:MAG: iron ABC transporter permease [Betaproteobacteria bacterium]|nr:iron ABC transporter permease [Betaproteobacteria bacterium]
MTWPVVSLIVLLAPASLLLAVAFGSAPIGPEQWFGALLGGGDEVTRAILWSVRAPRALAAFACGALLALSGALLQALLRNPLADPGILGISGGAAVGALAAIVLGLAAAQLHLFALGGAALAAGAVFAFSLSRSGWNPYRVLLAGIALSSGFGAIIGLFLALAPAAQVQGMLFWLLGDLSPSGNPASAWVVLLGCAAIATSQAAGLDVLLLGEDKARSLGVAVGRLQSLTFACAIVATVAAVLLGGAIGFVGLVVPHLVRLAGARRHVALLPLSACGGGALLTFADTLARTAVAPAELPVGAITALIGVPALLALLVRLR